MMNIFSYEYNTLEKIASIVLIIICLAIQYPTYKAYYEWGKYEKSIDKTSYKDVVKQLKPLSNILNDNHNYLFDYAYALSKSGYYIESNLIISQGLEWSCDPMFYNLYGQNFQFLSLYERAEASYIKAYNLLPNRLYPLYLLSRLYAEQGKMEMAKKVAVRLFNHKIIVPSKAIDEMKDSLSFILNFQ